MNTERLIHMPQCSTIDLSALCNSWSSKWKTIESHRWVNLTCENIGMCLSYVPFTLVIRLINSWDFIQIWYDNKMLSSQWDNDNQHFVYIIVSWYLLGIITRQGFLFSCSCMNRCTCWLLGVNQFGYFVSLFFGWILWWRHGYSLWHQKLPGLWLVARDWLGKWLIMLEFMDLRRPRVFQRSNAGSCSSYGKTELDPVLTSSRKQCLML